MLDLNNSALIRPILFISFVYCTVIRENSAEALFKGLSSGFLGSSVSVFNIILVGSRKEFARLIKFIFGVRRLTNSWCHFGASWIAVTAVCQCQVDESWLNSITSFPNNATWSMAATASWSIEKFFHKKPLGDIYFVTAKNYKSRAFYFISEQSTPSARNSGILGFWYIYWWVLG